MRRAGWLALAVVLLAAAPGCDRRPRLVPASRDSTAAAPDSFRVFSREATDRWEAGQDENAAGASARVVLEALRLRPNAPWAERARGVLDSLGIGAEVSGDERAIVANVFSRTNPEGGSWPYLFWREPGGLRLQALEGQSLHLNAVATRAFRPKGEPLDSAQVAVLWGRRAGGGQQPVLVVWKYARGGRWDLMQTLGPDSLGGTGSGEFAVTDTLGELLTRTFRPAQWFDECATCPHVYHERRFLWGRDGFTRLDDQLVPSPYSSFVALIAALIEGDRDRASRLVTDPSLLEFARRFEWHVPARGRWRLAPASDESATQMVFFRGQADAFRVTFEARDGEWVVAGFEPTTRGVE